MSQPLVKALLSRDTTFPVFHIGAQEGHFKQLVSEDKVKAVTSGSFLVKNFNALCPPFGITVTGEKVKLSEMDIGLIASSEVVLGPDRVEPWSFFIPVVADGIDRQVHREGGNELMQFLIGPDKHVKTWQWLLKYTSGKNRFQPYLPVPMFESKFAATVLQMTLLGLSHPVCHLLEIKMRPIYASQVLKPVPNCLTPAWLLPTHLSESGLEFAEWKLFSLSLTCTTIPDSLTIPDYIELKRTNMKQHGVTRLQEMCERHEQKAKRLRMMIEAASRGEEVVRDGELSGSESEYNP